VVYDSILPNSNRMDRMPVAYWPLYFNKLLTCPGAINYLPTEIFSGIEHKNDQRFPCPSASNPRIG
jgi:hypothetical protein